MVFNVKFKFDANCRGFSVTSVEPDGSFVGEISVGGCCDFVEAGIRTMSEIADSFTITSISGED